jgi:hypothetical protein
MDLIELVLLAVVGGLLVWIGILTLMQVKQRKFLKEFTQGVTKRDLKTILENIATSMKTAGREINHLHQRVDEIAAADKFHLQKVGFVRFNPFSDTGGDQSFCICFLDENDTGVVITSLHSREQTRIYAKMVRGGKAEGVTYSKEEKEAINEAIVSVVKPKEGKSKNKA